MDFWVAIPDSALSDEQTVRDKSSKIAQLARAFTIFRVSKVYIYRDKERNYSADRKLLKLILEFLDTPPYLRKSLYPMKEELRFAGLLHPLKAPHHKPAVDIQRIKAGEIRQAVIVNKGKYFADVGLSSLVPLEGPIPNEKRITVKIISGYPKMKCKAITREQVKDYWGYEVEEAQSLVELLKRISGMIIFTSREGERLRRYEQELKEEMKNAGHAMVVFGSPSRGLIQILKDERRHPKEFSRYFLNFFPKQAVETVRLEEAIMGCLSLLNYLANK